MRRTAQVFVGLGTAAAPLSLTKAPLQQVSNTPSSQREVRGNEDEASLAHINATTIRSAAQPPQLKFSGDAKLGGGHHGPSSRLVVGNNLSNFVELGGTGSVSARAGPTDFERAARVVQESASAAVADIELQEMMKEDGIEKSSFADFSLRDFSRGFLRDLEALTALFESGDADRGVQMLVAMSAAHLPSREVLLHLSSHGQGKGKGGMLRIRRRRLRLLARQIKTRLARMVSSLKDVHDTHTLEILLDVLRPHQLLTPAAESQLLSASPPPEQHQHQCTKEKDEKRRESTLLELMSYGQRCSLYCLAVDALVDAIAEGEFFGATHFRNLGAGSKGSGDISNNNSKSFPPQDFQQRRLSVIARAADSLPMTLPFAREWLDKKYRATPYSLIASHPDAKRIENKLYRRHQLQHQEQRQQGQMESKGEDTNEAEAGGEKARQKRNIQTKSRSGSSTLTKTHNKVLSPSASSSTTSLFSSSPRQLRAIVAKYEKSLSSAVRLFQPSSPATASAAATTGIGNGLNASATAAFVTGPHLARIRRLHLRTIGQPLVALLYLKDLNGATRLMNLACGDVSSRSEAQRAAMTYLIHEAFRASRPGEDTAIVQRKLLMKVFSTGGASSPSLPSSSASASLLTLITGHLPEIVAHDLHMAFMAEFAREVQQKSAQGHQSLPTMATDSVIAAHFKGTMKALVATRRDATPVVNLAFASSFVMGDISPFWALPEEQSKLLTKACASSTMEEERTNVRKSVSTTTRRSLFSAIVSATCCELEKEGRLRDHATNTNRDSTTIVGEQQDSTTNGDDGGISTLQNFLSHRARSNDSTHASSLSAIKNSLSLFNADNIFWPCFMSPKSQGVVTSSDPKESNGGVGNKKEEGGLNESNTTRKEGFYHHRSLRGFAQHLVTTPSRFPYLDDTERLALITSLINNGNKLGIIRKALDAMTTDDDARRSFAATTAAGDIEADRSSSAEASLSSSLPQPPMERDVGCSSAEATSQSNVPSSSTSASARHLQFRRHWLWNMAWLLSEFSWNNSTNSLQQKKGQHQHQLHTAKEEVDVAINSSRSEGKSVPTAVDSPTLMGISSLWNLLREHPHQHQSLTSEKREEKKRSQNWAASTFSYLGDTLEQKGRSRDASDGQMKRGSMQLERDCSTSIPFRRKDTSQSDRERILSLLARIVVAGPTEVHQQKHVRAQYWDKSRQKGEHSNNEKGDDDNEQRIASPSSSSASFSARKEALLTLAALLERDDDFTFLAKSCLEQQQHHQEGKVSAPSIDRGCGEGPLPIIKWEEIDKDGSQSRLELLLRAEGSI